MKRRCRWLGHKYAVLSRPAENAPHSRWGIWMEVYWEPCVRCDAPPPPDMKPPRAPGSDPEGSIWDMV